MLSVCAYKHPEEFPPDVQRLFAMGEQGNIESGAAWYRNLIHAVYPLDSGVYIYVLRKNDHPVAALALRVTKSFSGQNVASLSNYYTALYLPLIDEGLAAHELATLISTVKDAHAPVNSMRFSPMDPEAASYQMLLQALQNSGLVVFKFFCFSNWYLQVKEDWATYLKLRNGAVRSTIQRMGKKFLAAGGTLELTQEGANLDRGLAAYERVYASSWKQPEPHPEFVPGLIKMCADRGWFRLGVAWLNGEPIAAQFWIVANGKANIYKMAYDERYKSYSSGTLLTAMMMEHAIDKWHVLEVDYLIGDDHYKKSWMSQRRERWGLIAYSPRTAFGLLGLAREVTGRAIKRLKKGASVAEEIQPLS